MAETERRPGEISAEELYVQLEKMEQACETMGGIAHDINNFLTVATGALYLHKKAENLDDSGRKRELSKAEEALTQIKDAVRFILTLSSEHRMAPNLIRIDMAEVLCLCRSLIDRIIDTRIMFSCNCVSRLPLVEIDLNRIQRCVLNMALNASQAFTEQALQKGNAEMCVSTRLLLRDGNRYVILRCWDNGSGIPPEFMEKVWEPRFTTKEGGSGIGMSQMKRIAEEHSGFVELESSEEKGTFVTLAFPAYKRALR